MGDGTFIWSPKLTKKLFELRFEYEWLFKKKKQAWHEFRNILLQNGFPEEMTVNHVRKKWSYTYDCYRLAKRTRNRKWKYFKMFDKHYGKLQALDKYESWTDEWRLKLVVIITESKALGLDEPEFWKCVEKTLRCQSIPSDCCIQDVKGLWQHLRITFNRKHRLKLRKREETSDWPLYSAILTYYERYEQELLVRLEAAVLGTPEEQLLYSLKAIGSRSNVRRSVEDSKDGESEFQWSRDITETMIQIRLQHDWLFREKKWAWSEMTRIMIKEYGFPKTLTSRDLSRKWQSTYSDYQKALATNNTSWIYYNLFKCYYGDGNFSLNPLNGWSEEWISRLITAKTEFEHMFTEKIDDQKNTGWREVEKKLRSDGLPLDHSLLDLRDMWSHLVKTYKWKKKFADKGMLTEHWPYYDAITSYMTVLKSLEMPIAKLSLKKLKDIINNDDSFEESRIADDDFDDDIKLFDLKQKLKPKIEKDLSCRTCNIEEGSYNIFEACDDDGFDLAHKLKAIAGVEIDKDDNLPKQICFSCLRELENAYSFRRKCQDTDKEHRIVVQNNNETVKSENIPLQDDATDYQDFDTTDEYKQDIPPVKREKKIVRRRKKAKKEYVYTKICEICGKHTNNLRGHLDAHSVDKAYSCDICDKKFKFKSGLQVHRAVHEATPRKTCEVCGKTFHIVAQYRRHFVYHANERRHACPTCGKRFNTPDILRVHLRMHTDERPFLCPHCGKTFRTAGCVSRHKRIVHKNVVSDT